MPIRRESLLRVIGGSRSSAWNTTLAQQVLPTFWAKGLDPETCKTQLQGSLEALAVMAPKDEIEGMIAAQMIACHHAAMECYRRAMITEQTFEGRSENLSQANKLSRTHATLVEALNRHRGKGQQKVTVEHVHVHAGGQAIVGPVTREGGGAPPKTEDQPLAKQITHAQGVEMPREIEAERARVQVARGSGI
jgi:hypothetical protein